MTPAPNRRWFLYWLLVFGVVAFAIPEAVALLDPEGGDTLSESLRWVTAHPLAKAAFLSFIGWFTWHVLWQRPRRTDDD